MGWQATVIAVSTGVLAIGALGIALLGLFWFRDLSRTMRALERVTDMLERETLPALGSATTVLDDAGVMIRALKEETNEFVSLSTDLRKRIRTAADSVEDRLVDLDALVDVAQTEIEDTVLDVSAALRTGRRTAGIVRRVKRALTSRRRR